MGLTVYHSSNRTTEDPYQGAPPVRQGALLSGPHERGFLQCQVTQLLQRVGLTPKESAGSIQPCSWGENDFLVQLRPRQSHFSINNRVNEQTERGRVGKQVSRTAVGSAVVAEGTACGKGVMGYFWSHRQCPHHSQVQEGTLDPESQDLLMAIAGQSIMGSPLWASVSSWVT